MLSIDKSGSRSFYSAITVMFMLLIAGCGGNVTTTSSADCSGTPLAPQGAPDGPAVWMAASYPVSLESDVVYAQALTHEEWRSEAASEMDLLLDVYRPEGAPGNRPAILLMHGGGFTEGSKDKAEIAQFARYFTERGFVAISISYRLAHHKGTLPWNWQAIGVVLSLLPTGTADQMRAMYPAARDAKAAVRWVHAHADELGINPDYITALGDSAGAQLAVVLGTTDAEDFTNEISSSTDWTLASTNLNSDDRVRTAVSLWGSGLVVEFLNVLWFRNRWDAGDAALSMVHGTIDTVIPYTEPLRLKAAYCLSGAPFEFHTLHGARHGAWDAVINGQNLKQMAFDFVIKTQNLSVL